MTNAFWVELVKHVRSLSRLIYVVTEEEDIFIKKFRSVVKKFVNQTYVFNSAFGLKPIDALTQDWKSKQHAINDQKLSIHEVLTDIYKDDPKDQQSFYLITDPEIHLQDWLVQRRLLNIVHQLHNDPHTIKFVIFVSSRKYIPSKLASYMQVVEDKGLTDQDIAETLATPMQELKIDLPENYADLFRGFTRYQILSSITQMIIEQASDASLPRDRILPASIHNFRRQQLKRTSLIQYIDPGIVTCDQVGGVSRFKEWAKDVRSVFTDEGRAYGLKVPKGVLLAGVWGTGKSLSAKMLCNEWGLPAILLEMGRLRSSGVGDTEDHVYQALKMVESCAPCLLWIDEAEKSLAGGQSSAISDSGTTARSLGIFSTWIQENKLPVTLVLTANRLSTLPVEFINRMDERWFFDLPNEDERIQILKIHLKRVQMDPAAYDLAMLAEMAKDMVGREIEQCIDAAMLKSFNAKSSALDEAILATVLRRKPRIVKTMTDEVKELTDWVGYDPEADDGIKARWASPPSRIGGKFRSGAFQIIEGG